MPKNVSQSIGPLEMYHTRTKKDLGVWAFGDVRFKAYTLLAHGKSLATNVISAAQEFVKDEVLGRMNDMGDSNSLGFVIIHPGDIGLTIAAHWWAQGSVLCQHIYRRVYEDAEPLETVTRPAVGCVWELEIITAEQEAWRATMMTNAPDPEAYLAHRVPETV